MKASTQTNRDISSTILCVTGLCIIIIGFSIIFDKFDLSILGSLTIGAGASILNRYLYLSKQVLQKRGADNAIVICLQLLRIAFMSAVVLILLVLPGFNVFWGISAMLFSPLSQLIIYFIKKAA